MAKGFDAVPAFGPSDRMRPIDGFGGRYFISSNGRVFNAQSGRWLANVLDSDGYETVRLSYGGESTRFKIQRLVCHAFHGEPFKGAHAAHLDGNKRNNTPGNLCWATPSENCRHKETHGTRQSGERNGRTKFGEETIERVRQLHRAGHSNAMVAERTGVSKTQVQRIVTGAQRND